MARQYKHKYTNSDDDVCTVCIDIIKKGLYNKLSSRNKQHPCAPCYPNILNHPHACSLQMLHFASTAHQNGSITDNTYNRWVELNGMEYHTTGSQFAFQLWEDRLKEFTRDKVLPELYKTNTKIYEEGAHEIPNFIICYKCPIHKTWKIRFKENYNYRGLDEHANRSLHDLFPPPTEADGNKINLPVTHLTVEMLRNGHVKEVNTVFDCFCIGTIENMITMHLVNILGNPSYKMFHNLMANDHACCLSDKQYFNYAKAIGVAVRRCSRWIDGTRLSQDDICRLSYWEMCLGRLTNKSNWAQEKKNRCTVPIYLKLPYDEGPANKQTNSEYLNLLRQPLVEIFEQILTQRHSHLSWADFVEQRQLWITGGSAGGEKIVIDQATRRIDKKVLFEQTPSSEMIGWLDSEPEIKAVASEKYEVGKPRAIYGASPLSYMILTYLTKDIESNLNCVDGFEDGLSDQQELEALVTRMKAVAAPGVHTTMVDYADFNLQHTLEAQYLMFDVIYEIMKAKDYHADMIKAANWARKAMLNQWVRFPNDKKYYRVAQGMFSGIRSTNLMNTVLNKGYFMVAHKIVTEQMGIQPVNIMAIHKGDDVWISNHNLVYSISLYMNMSCSNLEFMPSKQLLGEEGEFLRIRYWADRMLGYLCRAIGSLIERPMQSADTSTPATMLHGIRAQINILYRRGLKIEACELIWRVVARFWANIKHPKFNDVCIPRNIVMKDHTLNGLDLGPPLTLAEGGIATATIPTITHRLNKVAEAIPEHMTRDYIKYLSQTLQQPFKSESVAKHLHGTNIVGAASRREKFAALRNHANELIIWKKELYGDTPVKRSNEAFIEYLKYPILDNVLMQLLSAIENKVGYERVKAESKSIATIFQAIHSSPFRDIATARRAMSLTYIEAAELCILQNPDPITRVKAFQMMTELKGNLETSVITRILSKSGGIVNNFESIFHPVALSWLNARALNLAVAEALQKRIINTAQWDRIIREKTQMVISTAYKQGLLLRIAGY